ncbi:MAG: SDR family NAD(P)-dependent oxidoreductase [Phycisphaerae bacterium]|nr:SDR family NAD(P)-dependent oxidoreductase [Phycisphaerae bacterium]
MSNKADLNKDIPQTPIAIIGMGCIFPTARNLTEFWRTLRSGRDGIAEVPSTHWNAADYLDPDPKKPDMTYCARGGFVSPVPFDPTEFGIPPTILEATDTTQLLGLVAAKAALEDGGYGEHRDFNRDGVSVVVGVTGTQELVLPLSARLGHPIWRRALSQAGVGPEVAEEVVARIADSYVSWQENSFPGLLGNVVAGRIANRLNLRGTNCAVDAACASSLSAIHLAMMELSLGRSEMALAGGADTLNDIFMYMCFSKTPALSPTGDARPFAADADGTVLGEGVGMVLLKRLEDAERDGDRIYAVIRSIGTSSDGRSQSIYAPHAAGQSRALREAYRLAGIGPDTVELIEAHGTGTKVGDVTEFEALKTVFGETARVGSWCAIGSVKSQIGHTKAAAGVAGLIKAALAIHHRALPPTVKVREPNPKMGIEESPFYVSTELRPWLSPSGRTRRAGVSAFGFGGSNFHAVLEEHDASLPAAAWDGSVQIIALSAATRDELRDELSEWIEFAGSERFNPDLFAYRASQSRSAFSIDEGHRLLIVLEEGVDPRTHFSTIDARLAEAADDSSWSLSHAFYGSGPADGKLAFVFPGQGSQYVKMCRDLSCTFAEMTTTLAEAEAVSGVSLGDLIYPRPIFDETERVRQAESLTRTEVAQPALGAVSLGLIRVLERFGVRPAMTAGHSFGELTALCAAGRIDGAALHRLARLRGRLMAEGDSGRGTMLAVKAPHAALSAMLSEESIDVVIANRNSPAQSVLSGERSEVGRAAEACKRRGWASTSLRVSGAFHSRLMESALPPFRNALEATEISPGSVQVFANTLGAAYPPSLSETRRILSEQLVRPVEFVGEIEAMHAAGARMFVEVGPRNIVTGLVREILCERPHTAIAIDASAGRSSGVLDLALVLARLAAGGFNVDLSQWELPVSEPRVPKMVVPLSGANYRAEKRGTSAKQAPRPMTHHSEDAASVGESHAMPDSTVDSERNSVARKGIETDGGREAGRTPISASDSSASEVSEQVTEDIAPLAEECDSNAGMAMSFEHQHVQDLSGMKSPALNAESDASVSAAALHASMQLVQQGMTAMQRLQQQTAEAHQRFLEGQTQAHQTLQMILESHQRMVGACGKLSSDAGPHVPELPRASGPTVAANPSNANPSVAALPKGIEYVSPARVASAVAVPGLPATPIQSPFVETISKVVGPNDTSTATTVEAVVAPKASQHDSSGGVQRDAIKRALIEVVCEKTGYPVDMIDLSMDIEADLGVDSIKRVEIIAGLEERVPTFCGVKPEYMGSIRTLAQIVDFVTGDSGGGASSSVTGAVAPGTDVRESGRECAGTALGESAAPADASGNGVGRAAFEDSLLAVVAELTGYPRDMLELGMDMEADLGIDSIKRVEILAGVEARVPGLPTVKPEYMGSLRTLAQIADYCIGETGGRAPVDIDAVPAPRLSVVETPSSDSSGVHAAETAPEGATSSEPAPRNEAKDAAGRRKRLNRRVLSLVDLPSVCGEALRVAKDREILVTDDGAELSRQMVARLDSAGYRARLIPIDSSEAAGKVNIGAVIIVAPPRPANDGLWRRESEAFIKSAFSLMKAAVSPLATAASRGGALFATVSRMDGGFGLLGGSFDAAQGALAGLCKTAAREWPNIACRSIDVACSWSDAKSAASAVLRELGENSPLEVGLDSTRRRGLKLVEQSEASIESGTRFAAETMARPHRLSPGDLVIVTGGARGVTADAAIALARRYRPTLVLLGRTSLPESEPSWLANAESDDEVRRAVREHEFANRKPTPKELKLSVSRHLGRREIRRNLARIESAGSIVRYFPVDVCNPAAVRDVIEDVSEKFGPVRGLIHGAGVIEDRRIENKSAEQFANVFDTKVVGLRNVLDAIDLAALRCVVMFSSVSGRCGNVGQADYAAANEVLNKASQRLSAMVPSARIVSINWGPWDGGMVHPALRQEFVNHGLRLISVDDGAELVADELSIGLAENDMPAVEIVVGSDFESVASGGASSTGSREIAAQAAGLHGSSVGHAAESMALSFERDLDVSRHPFLKSHVIDGRPVLPAAMIMEWMGHAAQHANPGLRLQGLTDFRVLRGVVVRESAPTLRFYCGKVRRSGEVFDVDVEMRGVTGGPDTTEIIHARATVVLASKLMAPPNFEPRPELIDRAYERGAAGAYAGILFHGELMRGIDRVDGFSPDGIVVRVNPATEPAAWMVDPLRSHWLTDPLVVDCVFQAAILWSVELAGAPCLPSVVRSYRQYCAEYPAEALSVVLEVCKFERHRCVLDATILTRDGVVLARFEGVECTIDAGLARAFRNREAAGASGAAS